MEEHTKKLLLYGGGGASLLLLILYMKNKGNAQAAAGFAPGPTGTGSAAGGGTSNDALAAAQINAATQLAIAQGNQANTAASIAAQTNISNAQIAGAIKVADIQASSARTNTIVSAAVSSGGVGGLKALFDFIAKLVNPTQTTGPGSANLGNEDRGTNPFPPEDRYLGNSFSSLGSSYISPYVYSPQGYVEAFGLQGQNPDYYQGNSGSGDTSWFGTSPGENTPVSQSYVNPYSFAPTEGIPAGYQD